MLRKLFGHSLKAFKAYRYVPEVLDDVRGLAAYYQEKVNPKFKPSKKTPFLFGLEIEVENTPYRDIPLLSGWRMENDGSLRNSGAELISPPADFAYLEYTLPIQLGFLRSKNKKLDFSWRTSTHVHVNVRPLQVRQLYLLLLLYLVFEKALFRFSSWDRTDSIFCVPVSQTPYVEMLRALIHSKDGFVQEIGEWQKYSALNLSRLRDYGTVEFRHMGGADDLNRVLTWLKIIHNLIEFVSLAVDFKAFHGVIGNILDLNTSSKYDRFTFQVFKDNEVVNELLSQGDFFKGISAGISVAKEVISKDFDEDSRFADGYKIFPEGVEEVVAKKLDDAGVLRPRRELSPKEAMYTVDAFKLEGAPDFGAHAKKLMAEIDMAQFVPQHPVVHVVDLDNVETPVPVFNEDGDDVELDLVQRENLGRAMYLTTPFPEWKGGTGIYQDCDPQKLRLLDLEITAFRGRDPNEYGVPGQFVGVCPIKMLLENLKSVNLANQALLWTSPVMAMGPENVPQVLRRGCLIWLHPGFGPARLFVKKFHSMNGHGYPIFSFWRIL